MAKIKHPNQVDIIDELLTDIINKGIAHLSIENESIDGRIIQIKGKECINFGSYSYLGLEMHPKLKQGAIDATQKYGTQFPSSRVYLSLPIYTELEKLMSQIFGHPVIVAPSTTLAHLSLIPALIEPEDYVILDHQVHFTVQNPVNICKAKGTKVTMIRHNRMDILEDMIQSNMNKYKKIWYMADGIYSMYGDVTPINDLVLLLNKYHNFHVYIDDAHGMSWAGKNGKGWVLEQTKLHPKMILALSLSKGFGSGGGVLVFPDQEQKRRVSTVGGSLIFTGPLSPPEIGAALASAKIHLSDEIYDLQAKLRNNIKYFNKLLATTNLTLVNENNCPIFYIGMGLPRVGQNMVKQLLNKGFYVNIGIFPAVPIKCTGVRISLTTHLKKEDIANLVDTMLDVFPKVMEEENYSHVKIYTDFKGIIKPRLDVNLRNKPEKVKISDKLNLHYFNTITSIDHKLWNNLLGDNGMFDYDGLVFLEKTFKNNPEIRDNWKFHYFVIYNKEQKPVLATFFTEGIWKDDMLAPAGVSKAIEEKRKEDPYYLTSKTITMGSMITEGKHLYLDRDCPDWKEAMDLLFEKVREIKNESEATQIVLRDFDENDDIKLYLFDQGFIKITLPDTNIVENLNWHSTDELLLSLSKKSRSHIRNTILKYEDLYDVEIISYMSDNELEYLYNLYLSVQLSNLDLNLFALPIQFFKKALNNPNWEFIILKLKEKDNGAELNVPIAGGICYKSQNNYIPLFAALDYKYLQSHSNYRQLLYQVVKRAKELNKNKIFFGLTASLEKTRLGAIAKPQIIYMQADDNYKLEQISNMVAIKERISNNL